MEGAPRCKSLQPPASWGPIFLSGCMTFLEWVGPQGLSIFSMCHTASTLSQITLNIPSTLGVNPSNHSLGGCDQQRCTFFIEKACFSLLHFTLHFFTHCRFVATPCGASLSVSFSQRHVLALCLCVPLWLILAILQTFALLCLLW